MKLGNYWGIGDPTFVESVMAMDWMRYEVTSVNGKNVTLSSLGKLKNGTTIGGANATYNLKAGTMSARYANDTPYTNGEIIAGNLSEGDMIPPLGYLKVNKTLTTTYLGVARTVNIVNSTWAYPEVTVNYGIVYDQITGLILETLYENNQTQPTQRYIKSAATVIETNITGSIIPEFATGPAVAATMLLTLFSALNRRKKLTPEHQ